MTEQTAGTQLLGLAADVAIAWLSNPKTRVPANELPAAIETIYGALESLTSKSVEAVFTPAVSVRRSLASKDHIISMIDGKPYKMLKRHLTLNGLTPVQYRERYGLRADYPMVSVNYADTRRNIAREIGLGRKPGASVAMSREGDRGRA